MLRACIEENYDIEVMEKAIETLLMLFDREDINRIELLDIVEPFIVSLLQSDNYISKTEHLILKVTEYLTEIPADSYNIP